MKFVSLFPRSRIYSAALFQEIIKRDLRLREVVRAKLKAIVLMANEILN